MAHPVLGQLPSPPNPSAVEVTTIGAAQPAGNIRAAFVMRDNLRHRKDIENAYLAAIGHALATKSIIANAYFLPGRRFRSALLHARERGVTVTAIAAGGASNTGCYITPARRSIRTC